ncbi:hypothetical protein SARC_14871 [Sphaeroforma arctica JP610]|uniref:Uncharacterized protein n=1 Tax=Sphaeroforma arctica JP610 TaxID=667725 RepID=A0A0L0F7P6_9EUKA|nr:hypothetical protein SARC_14871 [Sphaeroforma arctica JP610]KNC72571.1 hypothetical protein SARC_14871 [Sphaeroforma arctica JP610]|eukprot:XP_014146473.1 hypothetical protein SARC_14871 [Sphaeroforma arctica JP610]
MNGNVRQRSKSVKDVSSGTRSLVSDFVSRWKTGRSKDDNLNSDHTTGPTERPDLSMTQSQTNITGLYHRQDSNECFRDRMSALGTRCVAHV